MLQYIRRKVFYGYLEKEPKYSLPSAPKDAPGELHDLKPSVQAVNICHHGNEAVVVLEGKNLWFCHQITVGRCNQLLPAQKTTASSIQFNFEHKDRHKITISDGRVMVSIQSYFNRKVEKFVTAHLEVKYYYKFSI